MGTNTIQSQNPSASMDLMQKYVGKTVTSLVRYSWWKKEDIPTKGKILREQSFSLTAGPLAVVFEDGSILGVSSDPSINSVVVWLDHSVGQTNTTQTLSEDPELFPINARDEAYSEALWCKFMDRTLTGFTLLKSREMNSLEAELPSELGLCFNFGANDRFIASHGLHNGTDDFSVIVNTQINPIVRAKLDELPLL